MSTKGDVNYIVNRLNELAYTTRDADLSLLAQQASIELVRLNAEVTKHAPAEPVITDIKHLPEIPVTDEQGDGIPTLECEKATVFKVDYNDLDEFLSEVYGIQFEIVAEEELNNYSDKSITVESEQMDEYWQARFKEGRYDTRSLMNQACYDGLLEPGEYVIHIFW